MQGEICGLFHYPIKGLRAQPLDVVDLVAGHGFPHDRVYGFARPGSGFDPENPKPLPKTKFVVLARDAGLATLTTHFDAETACLKIRKQDKTHLFDLATSDGRKDAAALLTEHLAFPANMQPTLFSADPHRFTDVSVVSPAMMNAVSLINLDSVAEFSNALGHQISPARFRGNIHFSGLPPFSELDWTDRSLQIGDVRLKVVMRTKRCPATQVDPVTGVRDHDVPSLLKAQYGHSDMGVYAEVQTAGRIRPGDVLRLL
jgi:MOSC domain-containing protein